MAEPRTEVIQNNRLVWQSETAKTYRCPTCLRPIHSQYEGDDTPVVVCDNAINGAHRLEWNDEPVTTLSRDFDKCARCGAWRCAHKAGLQDPKTAHDFIEQAVTDASATL